MSARRVARSFMMATLGTLSGATAVLAGTGTIHLTASQEGSADSSLADALGALADQAGKPTASQSPAPAHTHGTTGHFTGDVSWSNPYGPVQVRINVSNGKITDSSLIQMPQDFTSQRISTQAAVYLREEVLAAQSASISWIGGASLTSPAYIESLSSAIAKAGI